MRARTAVVTVIALVSGGVVAMVQTGGATPEAGRAGSTGARGSLAATPPMGWNSWNSVGCSVTAADVEANADAIVSSGMKAAGYSYVVVDDCWTAKERDANGDLVADPERFPDGMAALADYVHRKGLRFGIYSSPGQTTCAGRLGSYGHEMQDAKLFARWGVDFLKYDACGYPNLAPAGTDATQWLIDGFTRMRDALDATGRPIVMSINPTGFAQDAVEPWRWAPKVAEMWRIGHDHMACFKTTVPDAPYGNVCALDYLDASDAFLHTSGPGHWNDFDMLEVGNAPPDANPITVQFAELATGQPGVHLSDVEGRTEFSIWAMLPAPLFAGNNLTRMSTATATTLTNRDVIAVNQDRLGQPATRVPRTDGLMVWTRVLEHGDRAVLVVNPGDAAVTATVTTHEAKLPKARSYDLRDLWSHRTRRSADGAVDVDLAPHAAALVRVSTS